MLLPQTEEPSAPRVQSFSGLAPEINGHSSLCWAFRIGGALGKCVCVSKCLRQPPGEGWGRELSSLRCGQREKSSRKPKAEGVVGKLRLPETSLLFCRQGGITGGA